MRLDKNKPYSEIMGYFPEVPGAAYEQGGAYFRGDGGLIGDATEVAEQPPAPEVTKPSDDNAEIVRMFNEGKTSVEIGRIFGIHFNTVNAILRRERN